MSRLLEMLDQHARLRPQRIALASDADGEVGYGDLPHHIARMAACIQATDPSTRPVGIDLPNGIDWVVVDLALLKLARPAVPLPSFFRPDQKAAALADAGASSVVKAEGVVKLYADASPRARGYSKVSYTSGSTGKPKAVFLTEAQLMATAEAVVDRLGADRADRHLPALPLGVLLENVAGLYATLIAGGTYLAQDGASLGLGNPFQPDFVTFIRRIETLRATSLILVPELLRGMTAALVREDMRLPGLDLVAVGGARVSDVLIADAEAVGLPVVQGYGLTEAGSVVSIEQVSERARGTAGSPLDHVRISVAPDGEVLVHPRDADMPIHTGDLGEIDENGRLTINGRKSNLLITAYGRNISPEWIESELLGHSEIAQAVVHGDGEPFLSAIIVPSSADVDPSAAIARVNAVLPTYARIGHWELSPPFLPSDSTLTTNGRPRRAAIMRRRAEFPFFDRLLMQTSAARLRLRSVPQLKAGLDGSISLETYVAYLVQAYHHVRHTVPLMREARARLRDRPELAAALDDYIAEEEGHELWILDDIAACGRDAKAEVAAGPSPATAAMVDHAYRTIRQANPVSFFGMVFVLEGTSIALAQQGASAVRASLGLPEEAFHYLTSHGALDQDHMIFLRDLMNGLERPDDQQAVLKMANEIFALFAAIFATIPMGEDVRAYA